ncbi:MAG: ribosome silencing factor [Gammaproteobacteria bacterium]
MLKSDELKDIVIDALEELKANDISVMEVGALTTITEYMITASGTSDRHVKSLADNVVRISKEHGERPLGVEGEREGEWVLVDLRDVIVHVMLPRVRDFYQLEKLWGMPAVKGAQASD